MSPTKIRATRSGKGQTASWTGVYGTVLAFVLIAGATGCTVSGETAEVLGDSSALGYVELGPRVSVPESDVVYRASARFIAPDGKTISLHRGVPVRWAILDAASGFVATVGVDGVLFRTDVWSPPESTDAVPREIARGVLEAPAFDPRGSGALLVAVEEPGLEGNALRLAPAPPGEPTLRTVVPAGAHNERATFSPDGSRIAFVSDRSGLPSVYVLSLRTGALVQLTNVGVVRVPGRRPEGFAPPPLQGRLVWNARGIEYVSPDGWIAVNPEGT